jgi:ADP-dependent NAD(P)H-hydrate dehydratase
MSNQIPKLPARDPDSNKGTHGRGLLIAGSVGMSGAAVLAGNAMLRSGAGLVTLAGPKSIHTVLALGNPCYMTVGLPEDTATGRLASPAVGPALQLALERDVVAIGPGLGKSEPVGQLVRLLLEKIEGGLVIDADGLNSLGQDPSFPPRRMPAVITPHPGEFARLTGQSIAEVQADREGCARHLARRLGVVVLLKGNHTVITDGERLAVNKNGNPGMARGGSGDVLTGVIAALLCQRMTPFDAAVLGAHVHGLAGDLAREKLGEVGMIATDLVDFLPAAFLRVG